MAESDAIPCEVLSLADLRPDAPQLDACVAEAPCDDACCPPALSLVPKVADDAPC